MRLSDYAIRHPVVVSIVLASLLVFSFLAYSSLNREMMPSVGLPSATVLSTYPGASAREIERTITVILEDQLSSLAGVSSVESTSKDSYSIISMEFRDEVDIYQKLPQIRELINGIAQDLPDDMPSAPEIFVSEASSLLPILSFRLAADLDPVALTERLDKDLAPRIARIEGVSRVTLRGGSERRVRVTLDLARMEARSIAPIAVFEALRYSNLNLPAGTANWRGREVSLTTRGAFTSLDEAAGLVVGYKEGSSIYLRDIGSVAFETTPPAYRIRAQGRDVFVLDVLKRSEGNTLEIAAQAKRELDQFARELGGQLEWKVITDQAETTNASLSTVLESALGGSILAVLVILLLLHDWRATVIIGASIPISILLAVVGMKLGGQTLNLLSLSGITVAIGMIVDASIVVLENTWDWYRRTGDRALAARNGAGEVGGAVLASTLTTIAVFAPLIFLSGIIGIVMKDLSQTIVYALSASLLVAVMVVPFLSARLLKIEALADKPALIASLEAAIDRFVARVEEGYGRALAVALGDKRLVAGMALSVFVASVILMGLLEVSFIPPTDTSEFELHVRMPAGYSLARSAAKMDEIESRIEELVEEVDAAVFYVGASSSLAIAGSPNRGFARIRLVPTQDRQRSVHQIIPIVRGALASEIPDADITVLNGGFDSLLALATDGQGFRLRFSGSDVDEVVAAAENARELLALDPDVVKAEISADPSERQLYAELSQRAMGNLGITPYEAGLSARILFNGIQAGEFRTQDGEVPLWVSSTLADTPLADDELDRISLLTRDGRNVRFSAFATIESETGVSTITKRNGAISVVLSGYLRGENQAAVSSRMGKALASLDLPPGVRWAPTGTSELIGDSMASLSLVLALSIFLVYAVMVIQFERYIQPLIILASIPLCLIGVVGGLLAFGSALSIIAMLGLITLGGTVVNNAIVMIDYMNLLRKRDGLPLRDAVLRGAVNRLQPILMTTLTTLFGVLPMALAAGDGAEVYAPLGQAIFGGLFSSTLITLFLIPVLYEGVESRSLTSARAKAALAPNNGELQS